MPPSPGHFCDSSVTAAPCGQKKQERAINHNHRVTGPDEETAGMRFRLATATTNNRMRSRRPRTRSRPVFFPGSGRMVVRVEYQPYSVLPMRKEGGMSVHPLDPLSAEEILRASTVLREAKQLGAEWRFAIVHLQEPEKAVVLKYQPGESFDRCAFLMVFEYTT